MVISLNPYCSGRWSRTQIRLYVQIRDSFGLNPYCSGRWSRTIMDTSKTHRAFEVLILIVVEDGLVLPSPSSLIPNSIQS